MPNKYSHRKHKDQEGDEDKVPDYLNRKGAGKMSDEDLSLVLEAVLADAEDFADDELGPDREKATDYYKARPFGNEEAGRSQIVLSEVRDAVGSQMPSLMRVFTGPEHPVEFVPRTKDGVKLAELMTDAVRTKFDMNGGFIKLHNFLHDGLVRKIGIFTWGWESKNVIEEESFSGLTEDQINAIAAEDGVNVVEKEEDGESKPESHLMPDGSRMDNADMPPEQQAEASKPVKLYKGRLRREREEGDVYFDALPPNELVFSRQTRTPYDTLAIFRRLKKTRGELLSMGYTDEEIKEHMSLGRIGLNEETDARNPSENMGDPEAGDENDEAVYFEGYLRMDYEGKGINIFKVCAIGATYHPLDVELAEEVKLAVWSPYPEPHTLVGESLADRTMDLQLLKSALFRGILDSLSASIFPRTAYIEGMVNPEDILNTEIGGPLRVKNTSSIQNAIQTFEVPFAGEKGLSLLQYTDSIRESRTGRSDGPAGLDQDALQSTEKAAAKAAVTASQMSIEMVARVAAEQGLKPLFRGIAREMIRHQPDAYMAKIRDAWVEVDPRVWKSDFDIQVNVALGSGLTETKLAGLDKIISRISGLVTTAPDNPIAGWVELHNALETEAKLLGYPDTSKFYKHVTEEQIEAAKAAAAQQPPPPSPEQLLAEAEITSKQMETEGKLAIERDRLALEERIAIMTDDRERDKNEANAILQRMKIESEFQVKLNQLEIDTVLERDRQAGEREQRAADGDAAALDAATRVFEATKAEEPTLGEPA